MRSLNYFMDNRIINHGNIDYLLVVRSTFEPSRIQGLQLQVPIEVMQKITRNVLQELFKSEFEGCQSNAICNVASYLQGINEIAGNVVT